MHNDKRIYHVVFYPRSKTAYCGKDAKRAALRDARKNGNLRVQRMTGAELAKLDRK